MSVIPVVLALTFLCGAGPATGSTSIPPAVTLRQAVAEALRVHPLVQAAAQELRSSEALLRGARSPLNPELAIQHGVGRDTGGLDEDLVVSQVFELGGKRRFRGMEAAGGRQRAAADLETARLEVAYQVRVAYLEVQEGEALQQQAGEFLRLALEFRSAANAQFAAGDVPRTQVIRSEIEVSARQQVLNEAATELQTRIAALNSLLGRPLGAACPLAEQLPEPVPPGPLETWRALAVVRPEVQAARAESQSRQAALRTARAATVPDLTVSGVHALLDEAPGTSVRVGLVLPLWDRGSLRARRDQARAAVAGTEAQVAEALRRAELETHVAYTRAVQAETRLRRYREGQLDRSRTLVELAQKGYEAGLTSHLELLDAQRTFHETRSGFIQVLAETTRTRLALERAAGSSLLVELDVPETKAP